MRADEARRALGVSVHATPADIKTAYRQRVKAWHPDRFGEDAGLRAQAEAEVKRIIEAYRVLQHAGEEPEPEEPPHPETQGASMFSVRAAPHHTATAAWAQHRRREELARERILQRRKLVRQGAVWLAGVALVVVVWRSAVWARSVWSPALPTVRATAPGLEPATMRLSGGVNVGFLDSSVPLADRTACFAPLAIATYRSCLEARAFERLLGEPVTTALPDNTPEYRKVLCAALQSPFDRAAYEACVVEVMSSSDVAKP